MRKDKRIGREARTIEIMIRIHCRSLHGGGSGLCRDCEALRAYTLDRLERCPFGEEKPVCSFCTIHCYKPAMREAVRAVMKHSGPRMLARHPVLGLLHLLDAWRKAPGRGKPSSG